ncbi:MAG: hypothetical protein IKZ13_09945 [Akkermansia sp.]|nr:hypothetical protein [Akkermansia sp.]
MKVRNIKAPTAHITKITGTQQTGQTSAAFTFGKAVKKQQTHSLFCQLRQSAGVYGFTNALFVLQ